MRCHIVVLSAVSVLACTPVAVIQSPAESSPEAVATSNPLKALAASMKPGQWAELKTNNLLPTISEKVGVGATGSIFPFSEDGVWDPKTRQFFFIGSDHIYTRGTGAPRFIAYSADSNTWRIMPQPQWMGRDVMHGYDHSAIDAGRGVYYYHRSFDERLFRYDIASATWTAPSAGTKAHFVGVEHFPELGGVVIAGNGNVFLYKDGAWGGATTLARGLAMGEYHNFAEYNPVHKVLIFGGGNGSHDLYKLDAKGKVTRLRKAPVELVVNFAIVTVDPVSGDYLVFSGKDGGAFYVYEVQTDTWTRKQGAETLFKNPYHYDKSAVGLTIAAPISTYGVVMFVKHRPEGQAWVYLYKHAER